MKVPQPLSERIQEVRREALDRQKLEINTHLVRRLNNTLRYEFEPGRRITEGELRTACTFPEPQATPLEDQDAVIAAVLSLYRAHHSVDHTWREPRYIVQYLVVVTGFYSDISNEELMFARWPIRKRL